MTKTWKSIPEELFSFLEAIQLLGACTIKQVQAKLKWHWSVIGNAKTLAEEVNLIETQKDKITLTEFAGRLLRFTGQKRKDFIINSPIMNHPTIKSIIEEASKKGTLLQNEIGDILKVKFEPNIKWEKKDFQKINETYIGWLVYLGQLEKAEKKIFYTGGKIIVSGIAPLKEFEFLKERELKHILINIIGDTKDIVKEAFDWLQRINLETNDKKRGEEFEYFIVKTFILFGFVSRNKNSIYDRDLNIFGGNTGGGDVALFYHFPMHSKDSLFEGGIIASEVKSTQGNVGSKAVGQARNLRKILSNKFQNYFVQPIIFSRASSGLDPSGKNLAMPEVVHISDKNILKLLEIQKSRLTNGKYLITPPEIFHFIEKCIEEQNLEPSEKDVSLHFSI